MESVYPYPTWLAAIKNVPFRRKLITGIILLLAIVILLPFFFQYIEQRQGILLNDVVLDQLPPVNVSIAVFVLIWAVFLLFIIRSVKDPFLLLHYLYAFLLLCLCRIVTITFVPLNAPPGLIALTDPLSNFFYGTKDFITKDLFFSGHTATLCLFAFCFRQKLDKFIAVLSATVVGFLVLLQHVHYTIDVVAAPLFSFFCFLLGKKIAESR